MNRIVKIFILACLQLAVVLQITGQKSIQGTIYTLKDSTALPGAKVTEKNTGTWTYADHEGRYQINIPEIDTAILQIEFIGYEVFQKSILLPDTRDVERDFYLTEESFITEEVVIQAVRAERSAPVSQITKDREEIEEKYTGQDGAFLLESLSPSIVSYSESGTSLSNYGQMRLRGIDQTRINITLNGVPLNDMIDQGVFFSNFSDFGNSIESVQIQRGVGTSTNGVASYAGSVNFESLELTDSVPSTELQLTGGSFNTRRWSAELKSGQLKNNTAFYSRFSRTLSDGYRYNSGTDSYSFFFSGGIFLENHSVKFTGFTGRSQNGLAYEPVPLSKIQEDPRTNLLSPNDRDDFSQWMAQVQHSYQRHSRFNWTNTLYYSGAGGHFPFGFEDEEGNFTQIDYPLFNDHYGLMSQMSWKSKDFSTQLHQGIHLSSFRRINEESIVPNYNTPYYRDRSQKDEFAYFGKAEKQWGDFRAFADIQVRGVQLQFWEDPDFLGQEIEIPVRQWLFLNPKAGITWNTRPEQHFYLSFGRSGREPTRFDILGSTQINPSNLDIVTDPESVQPEFVNDWELGFQQQGENIQLSANLFYMQFENEIAPIGQFIQEGFVQVSKNQQPSYRRGVELQFFWKALSNLEFSGFATYMDARISSYSPAGEETVYENVRPILSPEWNISGELTYRPFEQLEAAVRCRYLSSAYMELSNDPALVVPESFISDMRITYQFSRVIELTARINNIFDNRYYTYGVPVANTSGQTEPGYFVQPPLHTYVTLKVKF